MNILTSFDRNANFVLPKASRYARIILFTFFLKKPRNYQSGPKAIYMRIIVAGSLPKESFIGRQCEPKNWISSANRAKGNSENVRTLNAYLDAIDLEVEQSHTYLTKWGRKFRRRH